MIFSYRWLKELLNIEHSPEELAKVITFGGIEVEGYHSYPENLEKIILAKIVSIKKHPNADKLTVCEVDDGEGVKQVICGAPNCREGMLTAYAPIETKLGKITIEKREIRGITSEGMLCSEKDLELSGDHSGIMDIPQEAQIGEKLADYLQLSDTVFKVEVTPNRPDLLGMLGLARDIAALTNSKVKLPNNFPGDGYNYPEGKEQEQQSQKLPFRLTNEAIDLCSRYLARVITGVKVKQSPDWLRKRLEALEITPINNVVDITNYVMMEFGHPLHAFDYQKLEGKEIRVRRAKNGEKIAALDHKNYTLTENDLVIADGNFPVALAGVIGSNHSAIDEKTETIVLEAANFQYLTVRKTSQRYKINTDSAYRFERNLSDQTVALISKRATDLILELCGGEEICLLDSFPKSEEAVKVSLRPSRVNRLLTTSLSADRMIEYLARLGLSLENRGEERLEFRIPSYRKDLTREIDLIEEIIRLYGYNNIAAAEQKTSLTNRTRLNAKRNIADYLAYNGFYEAINSSFTDINQIKQLTLPENDNRLDCWELINPLGTSFSLMRTTLLPGLLKNVANNINNGQGDIKLFELGKIYLKDKDSSHEKLSLCGVITGDTRRLNWKYKNDQESFFTVKGYLEGLVNYIADSEISCLPVELSYFQRNVSAEVLQKGNVIGNIGKLDPKTAKGFDIDQPLFVFELDIDQLLNVAKSETAMYREINRLPKVERDISFVISREYSHQELVTEIREISEGSITKINLIDEFTGKGIQEGFRSLTYNLIIEAKERTLTDEYINSLIDKVINKLQTAFKIEMR